MAQEKYQKLNQREHVLLRPDTYVGSVEPQEASIYTMSDEMVLSKRTVRYTPAFVKIFDEILTNASDHAVRTGKVRNIRVNIGQDSISIFNDGDGIPVEMHKKEKMYIPQLIFGNMLSGENFDDTQERMVGGRNGMGSTLTNTFSKKFTVETHDGRNGYVQDFEANLSRTRKPEVNPSKESFTKITFHPDFKRFGMESIDEDTHSILRKRVLDVAAYLPNTNVYLNGVLVEVPSMEAFIKIHSPESECVCFDLGGFKMGVAYSDDQFSQISIINGISTYRGGVFMNEISMALSKALLEKLTKGKKYPGLKWQTVRNSLFLFCIGGIPNPSFDTQTKEFCTSKYQSPEIDASIIAQISKSPIMERIVNAIERKDMEDLKKLNAKTPPKRLRIDKLVDAHFAGTERAKECTLVLAEGDSAIASCLAGFSEIDRGLFGAYPLKGKMLNVRKAKKDQIMKNDEIKDLLQIIGLQIGKNYEDVEGLRYGRVVVMSDPDLDGYHVKALLLNFFDVFFPGLLKAGFIHEFKIPIVKVSNGKQSKYFYKYTDYTKWDDKGGKGWTKKYFKGLGTITPVEMKSFFKDISTHLTKMEPTDSDSADMNLVFGDKLEDARKDWILSYLASPKIDRDSTISGFINRDLVQHSAMSNERGIPDLMDGLKPSQRKIVFASRKRGLWESEMKVAQLSGMTSETTNYMHSEDSLNKAITAMAQDFPGSNNIPYLMPVGQFGSRNMNGKDAASPRYIYTKLNPMLKYILREEDEPILEWKSEEGFNIEPKRYYPVIPMVLVNGSNGVGTGWSTDIPQYSPLDVIRIVKSILSGEKPEPIIPSHKGFAGKVERVSEGKYEMSGCWERVDNYNIRVTEIPTSISISDYTAYLNSLEEAGAIKDYRNESTENKPDFRIRGSKEAIDSICTDWAKKLNLKSNILESNIHCFHNGAIAKFKNPVEMAEAFCKERLLVYGKRKEYMLEALSKKIDSKSEDARFIDLYLSGALNVAGKPKKVIESLMEKEGFSQNAIKRLLGMPIHSLCKEEADKVLSELASLQKKKNALSKKSPKAIWLDDLEELSGALKSWS